MTRKDYILIAAALRDARSSFAAMPNITVYTNGVDNAATRVADALSRDNPRFNRERFLKASGVQS